MNLVCIYTQYSEMNTLELHTPGRNYSIVINSKVYIKKTVVLYRENMVK